MNEHRILVADKVAEEGVELLRRTPNVTVDVRHGLSPTELAPIVGQYDGIVIRSAVKLTREALANPGRLSVIARAGVGVDNVDLDAATAAGILVLNTPDANTISAAEHAFALMLALYRRIPQADSHVHGGKWERSAYLGEQLAGKTVGVVGLGRIGRAVAQRARAFEMRVLAYDPFVSQPTALGTDVKLVSELSELLAAADCVSLHASLTKDTRHLIGAEEIALMKPGAKLINCARGALVDEAALAHALNTGRLGGAALDVFANEPPVDSPILRAKNVVLTPHLAASTTEAQTRVSVDAVEALLAYLLRGEIHSAVNVTGLPASMAIRQKRFVDLVARMGAILSPRCSRGVDRIRVTTYGESLEPLAGTLSWQAMISVLAPHLETRLNLVNARKHAQLRGITVEHAARSRPGPYAESVEIAVHAHGRDHEMTGTLFADEKPRVLSIDGYGMELVPERHIVIILNDDQPGVIGLVGQMCGDAGVNIADMALSRRGGTALMALKLDSSMPATLRDALRARTPPILSLDTIDLPPLQTSDPM